MLAALVVAPVATAGAASAAPGPRPHDSATALGRHFYTFRPADVVAGSPSNYLVVTFTAGRPLTDGTLTVVLPGSQWRTPLSAANGQLGEDLDHAVAARPWADLVPPLPERGNDPPDACSPLPAAPIPWTVQTVGGSQAIVVRHVTCAAGQQLYVHVKGIAAPSRVGTYFLPIVASDGSGPPRLTAAAVKVVPTPRVALQVTAPSTVPTRNPFFIQVDAVRPNGRPATDYSGAVAVVSEDQNDCTMTPRGQGVAYVPVRHRVARVLLDLCAQYDEGAAGVTMLVTQDDIAGLTGAGRPTVNQVLRTLESAGAIELHRGRIDVVDQAVLARHRG